MNRETRRNRREREREREGEGERKEVRRDRKYHKRMNKNDWKIQVNETNRKIKGKITPKCTNTGANNSIRNKTIITKLNIETE